MIEFWNNFIYLPIFNLLILLSRFLFNNLGLGIIALTLIIRTLLTPLSLPSIRNIKKMQDLKPMLDEVKKKYGSDKKKMLEEQARLYREHGLNPLSGCLPNILQFVVLIALYNAFISSLKVAEVRTQFLVWDLASPDKFYVLPVLAGLTQLIYSKMLTAAIEKQPPKTKEEKESIADMTQNMQSQMLYLMPLMTTVISAGLPSGLGLYWVVTTVFSIVQQYFTSGLGGLKEWLKILKR